MQLFHTSPYAITQIDNRGLFGEFLFFSYNVYSTTGKVHFAYSIEIDENEIINAGSLFYHEEAAKLDALVAEFCDRFAVDTDTAEEIISERQQLEMDEFDVDDSFECQRFTARAAKILGFRGVAVTDEHGTSYMIDMMGHEAELIAE